jgi:hypothetical protein
MTENIQGIRFLQSVQSYLLSQPMTPIVHGAEDILADCIVALWNGAERPPL